MALDRLEITMLVDDEADTELDAEHGLSMWIETPDHRVLFDTGQGPALAANVERLDIALEQAQSLVLSHGHSDHTGGLAYVLRRNPAIELFCHPRAVQPRYSVLFGTARPINMPRASMAALDRHPNGRLHWITGPVRLSRDIGLTGPIPRISAFEDTGGPFYLDPYGRRQDLIEDDTALWINTSKGLVVCMGCCHAGLINTLTHVQRLSGVTAIRAVIGGFHLLNAEPGRMAHTLSGLKALAPAAIVACHCTGKIATAEFGKVLNGRVSQGHAGLRLDFCG